MDFVNDGYLSEFLRALDHDRSAADESRRHYCHQVVLDKKIICIQATQDDISIFYRGKV
jgi:hypothetical protein